MDTEHWDRVQAIFHHAVELTGEARREYLECVCGADSILMADVLSMLQGDADNSSILNWDLGSVAKGVLDQGGGPAHFPQLGPYRVKRVLGEGGMGVVYLAEREDLHMLVAIKTLRDAWVSPARRDRFISEQRTLAQLNHPSITRLYDADMLADGTPWFAMEYVEGVPLTDFRQRATCSTEHLLKLFRCACEAVQYAHSQAIIHRDLKPSNILVKEDGSVRLLDFGIAKAMETLDTPVDQTRTGLRLMTPAYAAPEQLRGEPVGIQTDVYSLGVMLYELLTVRRPFDVANRTPAEAASIISGGIPPKPSTLAAGTDSDLDSLCLTAMHADPKRRYASVEALIRDIDHYLAGAPLDARPDSTAYRLGKFVSRNRRAVVASAVAFVAIVGLVVSFTLRLAAERDYANRQTAIATAVNQFLSNDLLGRGDPFQSGKAAETLTSAIQQASPAIDRKFASEPQVAARLHLTIAQALDNRSDFATARGEYERAHDLFVRTGGSLSQDGIAVELQRAAMEARTFESKGIATAKSLIASQEASLAKIKQPRKDLSVWLHTAKGMLALVESDAKSANQNFRAASDAAADLPDFDQIARFNLRQRLAFTYIRLGDGATAERLARELIAAYSKAAGPDSPYVLRVRLNLAQALMIEAKFKDSVQEANAIYPAFLAKFGPDHQLTMQLLTTRAQSEGSMGRFDDSLRDDLAIYDLAVKKQGPLSFYSIATLSDASVAQCRAEKYADGLANARKANENALKAFGPHGALTEGTKLPVVNCLIPMGRLEEASTLLDGIDTKAVAQLTGDQDWGAGVALARAEIAVRQHRYDEARKDLDVARPVFSQPKAEAYQRNKLEELDRLMDPR